MKQLVGPFSTVTWSEDGSRVTKAFRSDRRWPQMRVRLDYERRVNSLLLRQPSAVPAPRLISADRRARTLTFAAIDGDPLGPKFPEQLDTTMIDELLQIARGSGSRHC